MTITQLEYAVAVDDHRHFGKAAEACNVTQPTLSMQLQKLEDHLGVVLFDRSKKPIIPTEIGKHVLKQARNVLREANMIHSIIADARNQYDGEFRLGIIPTLAPYLLHRFIGSFRNAFPQVTLIIEEIQTDIIVDKLQRDQLDAALLATPLDLPNITEIPLFYEPFMAYISPADALWKEEFVVISELNNSNLLLLSEGHCFRNSVLKLCNESSNSLNNHLSIEIGNFETITRLVDEGMGNTLIPYLMALEIKGESQKNIKLIAEPRPVREISLIFSRNQLKSKMLQKLEEIVKASVPAKLLQKSGNVIPPK
ncbi:MAG: LysR family transcriptional regulator [Thermaurantimonas sp.]